ncbi:cobalamin B12-binding domain-containing protein [Acetobacterium tundrae]|uniref:Cobalamin-binding protein n=1 Tax=Acetobacterium tundrae TaxID=132932 RepID=A0ABR6WII6_9FIRM|nr:corrinoid protein [Acetobacterium tundrae]MBC3796159.1 cobalamin-binding protein [Acetobacterium tundrae]
MTKEEFLKKLSDCVVDMEEDSVVNIVKEYIQAGYDPQEGMLDGLVDGMKRASVLFDEEEYYIPELLVCADAMNNGIEEFRKYLPEAKKDDNQGRIVLAVVQGDTHDIGKDLVKIMLETYGYRVVDVGRDVSSEKIVAAVIEENADMIALSALMTTTMQEMKKVIELAEKKGIRKQVKIIIGGAPVSQNFSNSIGADGYSSSAIGAVRLVETLLKTT